MTKIKEIKEKENFIKHVNELLDNWELCSELWRNRTRGFFLRNLVKPHKAKPFLKLNHFQKTQSVSKKEFEKFKNRVRG